MKASETNGIVTERFILRMFLSSGYGPNKAKKWIDTYVHENILTNVGYNEDLNCPEYSCVWWAL